MEYHISHWHDSRDSTNMIHLSPHTVCILCILLVHQHLRNYLYATKNIQYLNLFLLYIISIITTIVATGTPIDGQSSALEPISCWSLLHWAKSLIHLLDHKLHAINSIKTSGVQNLVSQLTTSIIVAAPPLDKEIVLDRECMCKLHGLSWIGKTKEEAM